MELGGSGDSLGLKETDQGCKIRYVLKKKKKKDNNNIPWAKPTLQLSSTTSVAYFQKATFEFFVCLFHGM